MRILLAQINTTPGDFQGNFEKIEEAFKKGTDVDLIVTPELSVSGYLSQDLLYDTRFIESSLRTLSRVVTISKNYNAHIVVGYVDYNRKGTGKPFRNMAAVIHKGVTVLTYQKQLLPFYDVFDEGRYFEPGNDLAVFELKGKKIGLCICEDIWNDKGEDYYNYTNNPLERYRQIGVKTIVSINSSPYVYGKPTQRREMLSKITGDDMMLIYVNQNGAQDELVFDGGSCVFEKGVMRAYTDVMQFDSYKIVDINDYTSQMNNIKPEDEILEFALVTGLRDYVRKSGFENVCIASSGGIDSAVTIALACTALGPTNVHAIRMPSSISSDHSVNDARELHKNFGCHDLFSRINHVSLSGKLDGDFCISQNKPGSPVAYENLQARMRGQTLMFFSNSFGSLPLTTGNKTELAIGYCTLYGDMSGGLAILSDVLKTDVYKLADKYSEIPKNIIAKPPSAELSEGQNDEKELLPYLLLDAIVEAYIIHRISNFEDFHSFIENYNNSPNKIEREKRIDYHNGFVKCFGVNLGLAKSKYLKILRLIIRNEFKRRQAAPGIKVSPVAFGTGRRIPIVKGSY